MQVYSVVEPGTAGRAFAREIVIKLSLNHLIKVGQQYRYSEMSSRSLETFCRLTLLYMVRSTKYIIRTDVFAATYEVVRMCVCGSILSNLDVSLYVVG